MVFDVLFGQMSKTKNKKVKFKTETLQNNKIGMFDKKISDYEYVRFRTNVGKAYSTGLELFGEYKLDLKSIKDKSQSLSFFANVALVYARYGENEISAYSNNWVELVPPVTAKTGVRYQYGRWRFSYLCSFVARQFSEATNAIFDPDAIAGIIPAYYVMDYNMQFELNKKINFKAGVNNMTNNHYFTRRATGYPGPGIIPSDGISFYFTVGLVF